jgi:hypothetical protein
VRPCSSMRSMVMIRILLVFCCVPFCVFRVGFCNYSIERVKYFYDCSCPQKLNWHFLPRRGVTPSRFKRGKWIINPKWLVRSLRSEKSLLGSFRNWHFLPRNGVTQSIIKCGKWIINSKWLARSLRSNKSLLGSFRNWYFFSQKQGHAHHSWT